MKKKILTALMIGGLMAMNAVPSFAVQFEIIDLGDTQSWHRASTAIYNPGYYSYVLAKCGAVYANYEVDTLTQIHVRVVNADTEPITGSEYVVLTEGTGIQRVDLREGHVLDTPIFFEFRASTKTSASTIVDYYAK